MISALLKQYSGILLTWPHLVHIIGAAALILLALALILGVIWLLRSDPPEDLVDYLAIGAQTSVALGMAVLALAEARRLIR